MSFTLRKDISIFIAADSTVKAYGESQWPQQGWGKTLEKYFDKHVSFDNRARGGRSTKSFIAEGLWDDLLQKVKRNDVVLIQFGHNDHDQRKAERYTPVDEYARNLERFVKDVREKKAVPVLVTPLAMRSFKNGIYRDGHGAYPDAMRKVADDLQVDLIDLNLKSGEKVSDLGFEASRSLYMNLNPGEEKNYPEGKKDNTHLSNMGAELMASIIVGEIIKARLAPLYRYLK